jgi:hypothetical protein
MTILSALREPTSVFSIMPEIELKVRRLNMEVIALSPEFESTIWTPPDGSEDNT